jgi:hypothetical protein
MYSDFSNNLQNSHADTKQPNISKRPGTIYKNKKREGKRNGAAHQGG